MPFLTYDINPTLQMLAQGTPSPLEGLGQGIQNFAGMMMKGKQMQMEQEKFRLEKSTMLVQDQLNKEKLSATQKQNKLLEWQTAGDAATGFLQMKPVERAAAWGNLDKNDPLKQIYGDKVPTETQLKATQLRGVGAKTVYTTEQARRLAEQKAAAKDKEKKKVGLAPETSLGDIEDTQRMIGTQTVGAGEEPLSGEIPDEDLTKVSQAIATTANKLRRQAAEAGEVISEDEARQQAWDQIKSAGVIDYGGEVWGNNYSLNQDKLTSFLKERGVQKPDFEYTATFKAPNDELVYQTKDGKFVFADGTEYKAE